MVGGASNLFLKELEGKCISPLSKASVFVVFSLEFIETHNGNSDNTRLVRNSDTVMEVSSPTLLFIFTRGTELKCNVA